MSCSIFVTRCWIVNTEHFTNENNWRSGKIANCEGRVAEMAFQSTVHVVWHLEID